MAISFTLVTDGEPISMNFQSPPNGAAQPVAAAAPARAAAPAQPAAAQPAPAQPAAAQPAAAQPAAAQPAAAQPAAAQPAQAQPAAPAWYRRVWIQRAKIRVKEWFRRNKDNGVFLWILGVALVLLALYCFWHTESKVQVIQTPAAPAIVLVPPIKPAAPAPTPPPLPPPAPDKAPPKRPSAPSRAMAPVDGTTSNWREVSQSEFDAIRKRQMKP